MSILSTDSDEGDHTSDEVSEADTSDGVDSSDDEKESSDSSSLESSDAAQWKWCMAQLTWRGVRVPVVCEVPGADVLEGVAGGVGRVGRRGLVLHRAGARAVRGQGERKRRRGQ